MVIAFLIFLGLSLGSFVNALIWRLHEQSKFYNDDGSRKKLSLKDETRLEKLSISKGRSMCSHCGHPLGAMDLIPVLSWLALRGKCRYCGKAIPDTPVAELLMPVVLVFSYVFWPFATNGWGEITMLLFAVWTLIATCFVALALYDAKWFLLPDRIVWPLTGLSGIFILLLAVDKGSMSPVYGAVLGALALSGTFWLLSVISAGKWIGWGDVKLAISLGLLAGGPLLAWLVIFIASVFGTIVTLPRVVKGEGLKSSLPFGPHLIAAVVIVLLFGSDIFGWYFSLMTP